MDKRGTTGVQPLRALISDMPISQHNFTKKENSASVNGWSGQDKETTLGHYLDLTPIYIFLHTMSISVGCVV